MSEVREIRMEDENGNIYYPHNTGEVTFLKDGRTVQEFFDNGGAIGGGYLGSFANGLVFGKDGAPDSRVQTLCSGDINMFGPSVTKKVSLGYDTNSWKEAWIGSYSNAANGYTTLPNGFILQWGIVTDTISLNSASVNISIRFPISFPNNVLVPLPSFGAFYTDGAWESINVDSHVIDRAFDKNHFEIRYNRRDGGTRPGKYEVVWLVIGY